MRYPKDPWVEEYEKKLMQPFHEEVSKFMEENPEAENLREEMAKMLEGGAKDLKSAFLLAKFAKDSGCI